MTKFRTDAQLFTFGTMHMVKPTWCLTIAVAIIAGCASTYINEYGYRLEKNGTVDGCERVVWVMYTNETFWGDDYPAMMAQHELDKAGWTVITTDTNRGNQNWVDGYDSGARYLLGVFNSKRYQPSGWLITWQLREEEGKENLVSIFAKGAPTELAENFTRALDEITVYPEGDHSCDQS